MSHRASKILAMCSTSPTSTNRGPPDIPHWFREVVDDACRQSGQQKEKQTRRALFPENEPNYAEPTIGILPPVAVVPVEEPNAFQPSPAKGKTFTSLGDTQFITTESSCTAQRETVELPSPPAQANLFSETQTLVFAQETESDIRPDSGLMPYDDYFDTIDDIAPINSDAENVDTIDGIPPFNSNEDSQEGRTEHVVEQDLLARGLVTPSTQPQINTADGPKKASRKRKLSPCDWKVNAAKVALNTGKAHLSLRTGKERKERKLGEECSEKCTKCKKRLTAEERESLHSSFWSLGEHQRQLDYIHSRVKLSTPIKKYAEPGKTGKATSRLYYFQINGKDIRVCKTMFLSTLSICDSWIQTATKKKNGTEKDAGAPIDGRGRHDNRPRKTSDPVKDSVRKHINMIPRVESHYTRSRSKREYIDQGLTIEELYRRYVLWAKEEKLEKYASAVIYRKIFNTEFNIGTFKPKKDQCLTCSKWKHATTVEKAKMARMYALHTENRNISQGLKETDKNESRKDETLCVASYDLQKVQMCPKSEISAFYYKSRMTVYNFTIFDMGPRLGTCYVWNETEARKSSSEIASSVYHFIQTKSNQGAKQFIFYSDNPTSQNKNRFVFAMYLLACVKFSVKITHRFLEVGHTHMEVDSMHATIERAIDKREIFNMDEWYQHILDAKKTGKSKNDPAVKYTLEKVGQTYDILDFKPLVNSQNWETDAEKKKVSLTKIKQLSVDPVKPDTVELKYDFKSDHVITVHVNKKRGRPVNLKTYQPPKAYSAKLPLPANKIADLKDLMRSGAIPTKYHDFYQSLINIGVADNHTDCPADCYECNEEEIHEETEETESNQNVI